MSVAKHHGEWLSLIEISGPFLSMPVLMRVFPQGLEALDPDRKKALKSAYEEWETNNESPRPNPLIHREWVRFVLEDTLGFDSTSLVDGQGLPPGSSARMDEYHEDLKPDFAIINPSGFENAGRLRMMIQVYQADQNLDKQISGRRWKASPETRMMELLHAIDVPLGIATNGERWTLVYAPRGDTTSFISWTASLWTEEDPTLRIFHDPVVQ